MREGLKEKEVLAMYDVRGIQDYIFRTNRIKEIIGASILVENIIIEGIRNIIKQFGWNEEQYLTDWENDKEDAFLTDESIKMQVLFIGGGNAYVLFRSGTDCERLNRILAKYVLEHTYSLNLAVAVVEKTESYKENYDQIQNKMREIKAKMPPVKPIGAMPFMAADSITGYPLSTIRYNEAGNKEFICTESALKRKCLSSEAEAEKILDNMVTQKGSDSMLAVIHIDGNNMGQRIMGIMADKEDYADAARTMRKISKNIRDGFEDTYENTETFIDDVLSDRIKEDRKGKLYRKIIAAGDDITFICNAKAAIPAVKYFLENIAEHRLYDAGDERESIEKYAFSACAGIAFFNSHFPFSDAYQTAEVCCESAKSRAKETARRSSTGNIGCYFDYQICTHIHSADLEDYRKKNYGMPDGNTMIMRPYYVSCEALKGIMDLDERNEVYDSEILMRYVNYFNSGAEIPRSQAKKLRNSYALGMAEVEKYVVFLKSRMRKLPESEKAYWYDALEIMDLMIGEEGE